MIISLLAKQTKIVIIVGLFFFILFGNMKVQAEQKEIDINTSKNPNGYFFEVGNLKPGDWMPRNITIFNEGTKDFKYSAFIGKTKSVKGLLEQLGLLIKKDELVLYDGKIHNFNGFTPRKLASGHSETLFFQVTMPSNLGNEFQASAAEVEIKFLAEIIPGDDDDDNDDNDDDDDNDDNNGGGDNSDNDDNDDNGNNGNNNDNNDNSDNHDDGKNEDSNDTGDHDENESLDETPPNIDTPDNEDDKEDPKNEQPSEETPIHNPADEEKPPGNHDVPPDGPENPADEMITITPKVTEKLLPNTATNLYNYLFLGGLLLTIGLGILATRYMRLRRQ